jgi:hypothetical protein
MAEKHLPTEEANAHADANEDVPFTVPPKDGLPPLTKQQVEDKQKRKKDGVDKALEQLDEYYKDTIPRNPSFPHDDDHS